MSLVSLKAPEGATSLNYAGKTYNVKKGKVNVPYEAVEQLCAHGFLPESSGVEPTPSEEQPAEQPTPDSAATPWGTQ